MLRCGLMGARFAKVAAQLAIGGLCADRTIPGADTPFRQRAICRVS